MKHEKIPATINFEEPNQYINFPDSPVYINDTLQKWERGSEVRRAGVNSFGFSGTNCHMVIEEAPANIQEVEPTDGKMSVLTLSAKSKSVLEELVQRFAMFFKTNERMALRDICYTSNSGRGHYNYRP